MDIQFLSAIAAAVAEPFEPAICILAMRRRLWRFLPYFMAYLVVVAVVGIGRWAVVLAAGAESKTYSWAYWMTQPVHILARAAALADICRATLGPYAGVWKLARPLMMLAATLMLGFAAVRSNGSHWMSSYLIFVERELEFAVVILLLLLLALSRYYGLVLERPLDGLAFGLGFYSSFVIVKDTIMLLVSNSYWPWFSIANTVAYTVAIGAWLHALWAPLPERDRPELSTMESYEQNSREVSDRMRELNERLLNLLQR